MGGAQPLKRREHGNGVVTYGSEALELLGVAHAFSTRVGGVSRGPFATLNLGYLTRQTAPDDNTAVAENFRRLRRAVGLTRRPRAQVRQVHGAGVWVPPPEPMKLGQTPEADAMATDHPHLMLTVRSADCVPILMAGDDGRVVAAVHAGWRGIVAGIVARTVRTLAERFGVQPARLAAAVGPCIGTERYEVGPEVVQAFERAGVGASVREPANGGRSRVDLRAAVEHQLQEAGLRAEALVSSDRCTHRDVAEFFSYRRDGGRTGLMAAVICARPPR